MSDPTSPESASRPVDTAPERPEPSAAVDDEPGAVVDPAATTTALDDPAAGWRRLSIRMLAVHPIIELWRALPALVALVFLNRREQSGLWPLIGVAVVVGLGVTRWFTTTYRVTPAQIQVRRGLLSRGTLSVPRDRVRTVDVTSHLMHRLLGLSRITIGTGQSDRKKEDGLRLDALTVTAARRLRDELLHERGMVRGTDETDTGTREAPPESVITVLKPSWVGYAPFTLSGLATIGVVIGFVANLARQAQVNLFDSGPVSEARHELSSLPIVFAVLVAIVFVVVVVSILSMAGYILAAWNFRLSRQGATLHITRGLLTKRATTIEEARLRGAEISDPLLLRLVRGARATAITTGLRVGRGAERGGTILLPSAPAAEVARATGDVLGTSQPLSAPLARHGPAARRRRFVRVLAVAAFATIGTGLLWEFADWPVVFPIAALALFPIGTLLAVDRYRNLGHTLVDGYLVTRQGSVIRRRYMLSSEGIIGWNEHQSYFQRRAGLVTLTATTAAGKQAYEIVDVETATAIAVADRATPGLLTPFLRD